MIDTHCHVDLYPNPSEVVLNAETLGVTTIVVTNLPSAFSKAYPHVRFMRRTRLALGMHPLLTNRHDGERQLFEQHANMTSYIGEVGLDFSRVGKPSKEIQLESFRFILQTLKHKPKFMSLHSRQAESSVLDILEEFGRSPVVFHWYSGSLALLDRALGNGHYFSVNAAMFKSQKGQQILARLPSDRVLTETDGPFIKVGNRPAYPQDVGVLEENLADIWHMSKYEVSAIIEQNFERLVHPLKTRDSAASF
jgi:TatD DNase family protein